MIKNILLAGALVSLLPTHAMALNVPKGSLCPLRCVASTCKSYIRWESCKKNCPNATECITAGTQQGFK